AASLDHGHSAGTTSGELGARWFDDVYAEWDRDPWRHLNFVGAAVRRQAFDAAGGLDPALGLFAIPALAARLHDRGARADHVAGGPRPRAAAEGLRSRANEIAAERLPLPAGARYAYYLRAQAAVVRRARLGWVRDHVAMPPAPEPSLGRWTVDELADTALVGA